MTDTSGYAQAYQQASEAFGKFVPGFEFLQGLVKNAGKSMPSMGQWIAPTLDPEELERRIEELKTVQFWLEQNARMIGATVQALEVQRMTLGALKGMNVSMGDLTEALKVKVPDIFSAAAESAKAAPAPAPAPAAAPAPKAAAPVDDAHSDDAPAADGAGPAIDPMQWWGALTQQFTALASQAMQATGEAARQATEAARQASEATTDATAQAMQAATAAAAAVAEPVVKAASAKATGKSTEKASEKAPAKKSGAKAAGKVASKAAASPKAAAPRKATPRSAG
ncbi:PhaM family polyhydroxyalkanoate granule multifunctional regulatory protein [Leptothrix sp. BB-4]